MVQNEPRSASVCLASRRRRRCTLPGALMALPVCLPRFHQYTDVQCLFKKACTAGWSGRVQQMEDSTLGWGGGLFSESSAEQRVPCEEPQMWRLGVISGPLSPP